MSFRLHRQLPLAWLVAFSAAACTETATHVKMQDVNESPSQAPGAGRVWSCMEQISTYSEGDAAVSEWSGAAPYNDDQPYRFALVFPEGTGKDQPIYFEDARAKLYEIKTSQPGLPSSCAEGEDTDEDFYCFTFALPVANHPVVTIEAITVARQYKVTRVDTVTNPKSPQPSHRLVPAPNVTSSYLAKDVRTRLETMRTAVTGIMNEVPKDLANNMDEDLKKLDPECKQALTQYSANFRIMNSKP